MAHTYICFDADNDIWAYRYMCGWKANGNVNFDFDNAHELNNLRDGSSEDTIKRKLRERMANSDMLIVVVGESTKNLYKYVRYEIEIALDRGMPIVVTYLNDSRTKDDDVCPPIIKNVLALHIPFRQAAIRWAMENWRSRHKTLKGQGENSSRILTDETYKAIGL